MRNFVAVVALSILVGLASARQHQSVSAASDQVNAAIDRISTFATQPLARVLPPPPPPPPAPPINLRAVPFRATLSAQAAVVVDHTTDELLFQKNAFEPRPLASITKLMTALLLTEKISDWNATTTITLDDVVEGSHAITAGEAYTLHDVFVGGIVGSINTAMRALVRAGGYTQDAFVAAMNERAAALGLSSMHFADVSGLSPQDVGSAHDVARLIKIALSQPMIKTATIADKAVVHELHTRTQKIIKPTDWFLTNVVPLKTATVEGGKTGFTDEAGYNFASELRGPSGHEIRVVVLGADSAFSRFTETAALADWTFENFTWIVEPARTN